MTHLVVLTPALDKFYFPVKPKHLHIPSSWTLNSKHEFPRIFDFFHSEIQNFLLFSMNPF